MAFRPSPPSPSQMEIIPLEEFQTFSEEQFLLELRDDRSSSPVSRPPIRNRTPPYLGNLHLGFHQHQQHHHQHSETSENEIYDSDESNLLRTPLDRGPHFDLSVSKNITALVGKTAYLNCRVKNIGNKTIIIISNEIPAAYWSFQGMRNQFDYKQLSRRFRLAVPQGAHQLSSDYSGKP
uniref:Uncharacterized protein n=1 Tax=Anopheles arabiensis TaxID=7173 RepID=A0A182HFK6_ANOAR